MRMLRFELGFRFLAPVVLAGAVLGCGGEDKGVSAPDMRGGVGGVQGNPDMGNVVTPPVKPTLISNTPGATPRDDSSPKQPNLALLSSTFLQRPSGGEYYQQWLGSVSNLGRDVHCYVEAEISLLDAQGNELASFNS